MDESAPWVPPEQGTWDYDRLIERCKSDPSGDTLTEDEQSWFLDVYIDSLSIPAAMWLLFQITPWRFSILGVFWMAVGLFSIFILTPESLLFLFVGLAAVGYSLYLFKGGRSKFFVI